MLELESIIIWVLVGILCGWLAGKIFRGGGFGWLVNFLVGIGGSFVGGFLFGSFFEGLLGGTFGGIVSAVLGAIILLWIISLFKKK